ncbi:NAD(P)H-hydrate dehydratase [Candidatus Dojkabacteria bacterium]|uniref:Bifunctional NAD(P)H-hydrate repair enzyme n=1 Tax=Candidatus Dojkabacteria bacterium TaxID=2099670 RepID=A0A955RIX1_9BACT|nr:NAD(P)H-hydrate dehydratase [Candidatus Dojkabacteria bacterium]
MKILSAQQLRELEQATLNNQPISNVDLMERVGKAFVSWFTEVIQSNSSIAILVGKGNNGGDGLVIARLLRNKGYQVEVHIIEHREKASDAFVTNLNRIEEETDIYIGHVQDIQHLVDLSDYIVIDAMLGMGINKPLVGLLKSIVEQVNKNVTELVISVDMPTGLVDDGKTELAVEADFTFSYEVPKISFMLAENYRYVGEWLCRSIQLDADTLESLEAKYIYLEEEFVSEIYGLYPRGKFDHKGMFGHCLIVAGSIGMIGSSILTAKSCLKSGAGLVTVHLPSLGYIPMQTSLPDVIVSSDHSQTNISKIPLDQKYNVICVGPGLGKEVETKRALLDTIKHAQVPLVLDADALNIMATEKDWIDYLPKYSVLTPHMKEFKRLFGDLGEGVERIEQLRHIAAERQIYICLKGAHTAVATPEGVIYFNDTGNPGMAVGGSGDVLAGVISSLIAQEWKISHAVLFGVYLHGLAGDLCAYDMSEEGVTASDIINYLPDAFLELS